MLSSRDSGCTVVEKIERSSEKEKSGWMELGRRPDSKRADSCSSPMACESSEMCCYPALSSGRLTGVIVLAERRLSGPAQVKSLVYG